jgi:hypothetical protein
MQTEISPYLEASKQGVKQKISSLLNKQTVRQVASGAFTFHFKDKGSLTFQNYYREMVANQERFLSAPNFFREFKQRYSLQGIDGAYLDKLEREKELILRLLDSNELANLYFRFFADAPLQHDKRVVRKNLGSFFAKLVHTFMPDKYCALDNPIKKYLGLGNESFYIAFIVISNAYKEWASENSDLMQQIRIELERNKIGKPFSAKMTDLKLLDLIFWYQANEVE